MDIKNVFKISAVVAALALAGCGGDINLDASSVDNSVDNSVTTSGSTDTETNPCASYVEDGVTVQGEVEGDNCRYTSAFVSSSNELEVDVTFDALENGGAHLFNESLYVGENFTSLDDAETAGITQGGDGPTIFIEAGATLAFQSGKAVVINRGSQIRAEGTLDAPITFTSETDLDGTVTPEATQEWGGMVINGFGFTNACQYEAGWAFEPNSALDDGSALELQTGTDCSIAVEGLIGNDQSNFGGELPEDNSGELSYVVLKHAGSALSPGNELNGITFGAVGSETTVDNLQIYSNVDDGIEFFGGGVNVTNFVALYVQDDSIDIDDGYYGTITNALIIQGGGIDATVGSRTGAHCIESDGASARSEDDVFNEDYLSRGTVNNMTCISSAKNPDTAGNGDGGAGVNFEEGHLLSVNNSIVTTAYANDDDANNDNYCFQAEDDLDAIQVAAGLLSFSGNLFVCPDLTADGSEEVLSLTVDTSDAQYVEALTRRADGAAGPFSGSAEIFLEDTGNILSDAAVSADEGTTTNILDGFYSVPLADILIEGASITDDITEQPGSTFDEASLAWTYGLLDGARGQALWFEDGQTLGDR